MDRLTRTALVATRTGLRCDELADIVSGTPDTECECTFFKSMGGQRVASVVRVTAEDDASTAVSVWIAAGEDDTALIVVSSIPAARPADTSRLHGMIMSRVSAAVSRTGGELWWKRLDQDVRPDPGSGA